MRLFKRKRRENGLVVEGGFWWIGFMLDGKLHEESTKTSNKRQAEEIGQKIYARALAKRFDLLPQTSEKPECPLFNQAMAEFLEFCQIEHAAKPNTLKRKITASKPLLKTFGARPLNQISSKDFDQYKKNRARTFGRRKDGAVTDQLIHPATINRELDCARGLYRWAIRQGYVSSNPLQDVGKLAEDNERLSVPSDADIQKYLASASQPLQDIAVLLLETGLRPDDIYRMERAGVNLQAGYYQNVKGKTKAATRRIQLSPRALEILTRRCQTCQGRYLFPLQIVKGLFDWSRPMTKVNAAHTSAIRRAAIKPFRLYDLRHKFATDAIESGIDLITVARMMGHSSTRMVMRYAHPSDQHLEAAIDRIEQYRQRSQSNLQSGENQEKQNQP